MAFPGLGHDRRRRRREVERLIDVVVEPFAEEQQRLATTLHVAQPCRDVLDGLKRALSVQRPLRVLGILDRLGPLEPFVRADRLGRVRQQIGIGSVPQVNRQLLGPRGRQLLPLELVERRKEEPTAVRQLLPELLPAAGVDNGRQIARAEVAPDEFLGGLSHEQ